MDDCGLLSCRERKVLYSTRYFLQLYRLQATFLSTNNSNALQHSSRMIPPMCLRMRQTSMSTREISVIYRDASRPVTRKSEFSANGLAAGNVYLWSGRIDVVGIVSVSTFSTRAHLRDLLVGHEYFQFSFFHSSRPASFRKRKDAPWGREFELRWDRCRRQIGISEKSTKAITIVDTQVRSRVHLEQLPDDAARTRNWT